MVKNNNNLEPRIRKMDKDVKSRSLERDSRDNQFLNGLADKLSEMQQEVVSLIKKTSELVLDHIEKGDIGVLAASGEISLTDPQKDKIIIGLSLPEQEVLFDIGYGDDGYGYDESSLNKTKDENQEKKILDKINRFSISGVGGYTQIEFDLKNRIQYLQSFSSKIEAVKEAVERHSTKKE